MARRLQYAVALYADNGDATWYGPGEVSDEVAARIDNPGAFADDVPEPAKADPEPKPTAKRTAKQD